MKNLLRWIKDNLIAIIAILLFYLLLLLGFWIFRSENYGRISFGYLTIIAVVPFVLLALRISPGNNNRVSVIYKEFLVLLLIITLLSALFIFAVAPKSFLHDPLAISKKDNNNIRITFLQLNDVYEIDALEGGKTGGLARVAYLRKQLAAENPGTVYTVLAGDFLSPSAIGTLKDANKKQIAGKQMVDVLNAVGIDLVTFGNHEFDLDKRQLQECINLSSFDWVNINARDSIAGFSRSFMKSKNAEAIPIPYSLVKEFRDKDGTTLKVGFFGLTIESGAGKYVRYRAYKEAAANAIRELKGKCDVIIALTHLSLDTDRQLAADFPEINMIMGGHEHIHSYNKVGLTPIAKADANARTVFVHSLEFNKRNGQFNIDSKLVSVNDQIEKDAATQQVVYKWNNRADSILKRDFVPCRVVASLPFTLDGTESSIRQDTTALTLLIGKAMLASIQGPGAEKPVFALYNSGSIRIDDSLKENITEYDIFRVMPYPGKILLATFEGGLVNSLLNISDTSKGEGCFLQHDGSIGKDAKGRWCVNGKPMNPKDKFRVAINDYLLDGRQDRMQFLGGRQKEFNTNEPAKTDSLRMDIRKAVINYLQQTYPPASQPLLNRKLPCYSDDSQ